MKRNHSTAKRNLKMNMKGLRTMKIIILLIAKSIVKETTLIQMKKKILKIAEREKEIKRKTKKPKKTKSLDQHLTTKISQ
jgi:hypothetical protein